jgi:hypothetical protein
MITLNGPTETLHFDRQVEAFEYACVHDITGYVVVDVSPDDPSCFIPSSAPLPRVKVLDRQGTFDIQDYFKVFANVGDRIVAYGYQLHTPRKFKSAQTNLKPFEIKHHLNVGLLPVDTVDILHGLEKLDLTQIQFDDNEQMLNPNLEESRPTKSRRSKKKAR